MDICNDIRSSIEKASDFLANINVPGVNGFGIKKCSSFHDVDEFPSMCLAATYNATHASILSGRYKSLTNAQKSSLIDYFNSFQQESGYFKMPQMTDRQVWKGLSLEYTWQYINFHVTNYTYGAIKSLGGECKYPLKFIEPFCDETYLKNWLDDRKMFNPWLEGNNIVNLASFLIGELEGKDDAKLAQLIDIIIKWHNDTQDQNTGYWGTNNNLRKAPLLEGMAGAAHNYHIYYYYNKEIPNADKVIDHCIEFIKPGVQSACLDIDVVDILVNMLCYNYRKADIKKALIEYVPKLIAFQNDDGGFADEKGWHVRRMDGWAGGYFEPQGLSNCFATWFRSTTLAMIACALDETEKEKYTFRNTIGIGYYNKNYCI